MRQKPHVAFIVGGVLTVGQWLLGPGASTLLAEEASSTTADDPAFKSLAEVDVGPLESPKQGRTLPFQVPFVVKGTVDRNTGSSTGEENKIVGLRVHLVEAKRPIRVEEKADSLRCYYRGTGRRIRQEDKQWMPVWKKTAIGDFPDYQAVPEDCSLILDAGYWNAPKNPVDDKGEPQADVSFSLVLPPVEAGRHYALGFRIQRTLSNRQVDEIIDLLLEKAGYEKLFEADSLDDFFPEACEEILGYAERNGLVFDGRTSAPGFRQCLSTQDGGQQGIRRWEWLDELSNQETYKLQEELVSDDLVPALEAEVETAGDALASLEVSNLRWPTEPSATKRFQALRKLKTDARAVYDSISQKLEGCECATGSACRATNQSDCDVRDIVGSIEEAADKGIEYLEPRMTALRQAVRESILWLGASTVYDFNTRQKTYLSADIGFVAGIGDVSEVVPYLGTNIYFKPVNKEAPLGGFRDFFHELLLRCGVTVGATLEGLDDDQTRTDLFSDTSLVGGFGCRMTEVVRFGVGSFLYKELHPNPLIDDEDLEFAPYVSISVDWDVRGLFQGINQVFSSFLGSGSGSD